MIIYKAKITSITKVDNRLDIGGTLFRDDEEFPMPVVSMVADTATVEEGIELIKSRIIEFKAGYTAEAQFQQYIGQEITLEIWSKK